ncbi:hypothetical protein KR059_009054 [Drosophila kikkawai]|nr:hypothetical protein KR059_009054 [Drosophila kikkawai]
MTKPYLICGLELLLLLVSVSGIVLPEHNCSDYFTYGIEDGNYIGLFTAPKAGLYRISWNVTFLWHGSITENPVASLEHYPNRMEAIHNINSGRRAQLIARFKNISEELPKLVDLQINNETLCSNPGCEYN